ncbi:MAG: UDP-glucose 6-dehydrogenase TuaD [Candidatus Anoxychlamydiales bacterium]|nr:UDP-glucose 6-dehydrogenase TuaD [Candidatus Anoxychlamydiales bacterium]NGX35475.1 UDP-glucose 6-dehydrogenase TuaD [Candidatus Anoxychlamydiales bacterium]
MKTLIKIFIFIFLATSIHIYPCEKILVIGTGYVGLVSGTCFAEKGNIVTCLDIDEEKINNLNSLIIPIYEPGLKELVEKNVKENKLIFTTDYKKAIKESNILFICAPTPSNEDGSCNLSYVKAIAKEIGKNIEEYKIIVTKSTVPVGTTFLIQKIIKKEISKREKDITFDVASNSEFLKEGEAIHDCLKPDRIVIGTENENVKNTLINIHKDFTNNLITMDILSAEITKYAANAMLALKISFMNQIANICKNVGANVENVKKGIGPDKRIGKHFLNAGIGYGGSCFPKDVQSLSFIAKDVNIEPTLLNAIHRVNEEQKELLARYIDNYFENRGGLKGRTFTIWGLSFKPNTDDMRNAPSLVIIDYLLKKGAILNLYDPIAMDNAKKILSNRENINWYSDPKDAAIGSDGIVLVTEWKEFNSIPLNEIKNTMNDPNIFDGRAFFNPKELKKMGFRYIGIGMPDEL